MRPLIITGALAALLGGCAGESMGAPAGGAYTAEAQATPTGVDFVRMAGASDLYEIQSSQALLQSSQNANLRRFAQTMIENHTQTTATVTAAARDAGMTPPEPALDARKTEMVRQLQAAQGTERDRLYVEQQLMAHQEALALHGGYAENGDTPQLRRAAATARPIVERHLNEIQAMQRDAI